MAMGFVGMFELSLLVEEAIQGEETIQGRKLYEEIRYVLLSHLLINL